MNYLHNKYILCGYLSLAKLIIKNNYYLKNLYNECKTFVKNCDICIQTKNTIFHPPENKKYIQAKYPNEVVHMYLADIPEDLKLNNNQINKIAIIIDNLSKYAFVELIPTKSALDILRVFMKYVT